MKRNIFIILMCMILIVPIALAENSLELDMYNEIINSPNTITYNTDIGNVYLYYPRSVIVDEPFTVKAAMLFKEKGISGDMALFNNGVVLEGNFFAEDNEDEKAFFISSWNNVITKNESFQFSLLIDDKNLIDESFEVRAIEKIVIDTVEEVIIIEDENNDDYELDNLIEIFEKNNMFYSKKELSKMIDNGKKIVVEKNLVITSVEYLDGSFDVFSKIVLHIQENANVSKLKIVEIIPKEFAKSTDDLKFNSNPVILEKDPVIMWHMENMTEEKELYYEVKGNKSITGNSIFMVENDFDFEDDSRGLNSVIYPVLLIPLVAGIIIYFSKFSKKE